MRACIVCAVLHGLRHIELHVLLCLYTLVHMPAVRARTAALRVLLACVRVCADEEVLALRDRNDLGLMCPLKLFAKFFLSA